MKAKSRSTLILAVVAAFGMFPITSMLTAAGLTASDGAANENFGLSVSQSENFGLVGAFFNSVGGNSRQGSAYVFRNLDATTGTVTQNVMLIAGDGAVGDQRGFSVSQSGSFGLVGANHAKVGANSVQGAAYVFRILDIATGTVTQDVS